MSTEQPAAKPSKSAYTLVCFGDSIIKGELGSSYLNLLRQALPDLNIINAGENGDTILNLLRRYDRDVIPHQPDIILIGVGLNDLGTINTDYMFKGFYRLFKQIREPITPQRFARYYRTLIHALRRELPQTRIILCTPTTLGELPLDPVHAMLDAYATVVRSLAIQEGLGLIDLRKAFYQSIKQDPRDGPHYHIWRPIIDGYRIRKRGQTVAGIAAQRGFRLLYDGVHLSPVGAELAAQIILPQIQDTIADLH